MTLNCRAILFDHDGVLANSHEAVDRHWREFAEWYGLDPEGMTVFASGRPSAEVIAEALKDRDSDEIDEASRRFEAHEIEDTDGVVAVPGAVDLLRNLEGAKWAVATSCGRDLVYARMNEMGITPPSALVTADDVSEGKPSPECYLRAAESVGIDPSECVVFEDSVAGLKAGMAAGCRVVAVATGTPIDELRAVVGPDGHIVNDLSAVNVRVSDNGIELTLRQ